MKVPVWIAKVEAAAAALPHALLFHRDAVFRQPSFPVRQVGGGNRERDMKLAVPVVRRLDKSRDPPFLKSNNTCRAPACIAQPRPPKSLIT